MPPGIMLFLILKALKKYFLKVKILNLNNLEFMIHLQMQYQYQILLNKLCIILYLMIYLKLLFFYYICLLILDKKIEY